jgi:REP-associated tyrosine transposase
MSMRKPKTVAFWYGRLPHWEVEDARYFITIHLAGAIPIAGKKRLRSISSQLRNLEPGNTAQWLRLQRLIFAEMEAWLDRAPLNSRLRQPEIAEMVIEAIELRGRRGDWKMLEYVVMPTHLHLFCEVRRCGLKETVAAFKSWTGRRATSILQIVGERFWQREWFDHWSRSDEEDEKIIRYILHNPVKAGLVSQDIDWPYSGRSRRPDGT